MVGNSMFTIQLNNRLKDLKGSKDDGGVSIITIGDLFQLNNFITLLGILTITINRYYPKGNVRTGQKKPMRGTSLINFTKKKKLHYPINYS